MSEFLLITSTFAREPILAICWFSVSFSLGALLQKLNGLAFGMPKGRTAREGFLRAHVRTFRVGLGRGIYLPAELVTWFQNVARLLG